MILEEEKNIKINPIIQAMENHKIEIETYKFTENKHDESESNYAFIMNADYDCEDFNIGYEQGFINGLKWAYEITK